MQKIEWEREKWEGKKEIKIVIYQRKFEEDKPSDESLGSCGKEKKHKTEKEIEKYLLSIRYWAKCLTYLLDWIWNHIEILIDWIKIFAWLKSLSKQRNQQIPIIYHAAYFKDGKTEAQLV